MDIKAGDWIKVPKGTYLEYDHSQGWGTPGNATSRDIVVQVSEVSDPADHTIRQAIKDEEVRKQFSLALREYDGGSTYGGNHTDETRAAAREGKARVMAEYRVIAEQDQGGDLTLISWSGGKKRAYAAHVTKVEAPAPRKVSTPKINKRQQMVKKSRWKLTADVTLTFNVHNPEVEKRLKVWEGANPRPAWSSGQHSPDMKWRERFMAERKRLEAELGEMVDRPVRACKAGDVFTVTDKFSTYNPYDILAETGAVAWITFDGDKAQTAARYKQLEPLIEAEEIPTVDVYVLRNRKTGGFFKVTEYNREKTQEAQKAKGASNAVWHEHSVYDPVFVETFMKAKHFDNIGRAKSSILEATGYYYDLPGSEVLPEWMGHASSFDFTQDYELVKFDKLARKEIETIDLWDWYQQAWRLRELTVQFGSSVRGCYKELEKAKLLEKQSGMIIFTASEDAQNNIPWNQRSALTEQDRSDINEAIAVAGFKKGSYKRGEDHKSVAISFASKAAAMMFKLAYDGNLKTTVVDLAEMREVVETESA